MGENSIGKNTMKYFISSNKKKNVLKVNSSEIFGLNDNFTLRTQLLAPQCSEPTILAVHVPANKRHLLTEHFYVNCNSFCVSRTKKGPS